LFQECLVFFIFKLIELVKVLAFETVLVCEAARFNDGFLDERCRGGGFLGKDTVFAENVVPV
jgi:hypothetical protein